MSEPSAADIARCDCCGDDELEPGEGKTLAQLGVNYRDPLRTGVLCERCGAAFAWISPVLNEMEDWWVREFWPLYVIQLAEYVYSRVLEYFADRVLPHEPDETPAARSERIGAQVSRVIAEQGERIRTPKPTVEA